MTQFHIEDGVQHYEDRCKADARRGGKTQQVFCNMNRALPVFRYNAKEVRSGL